MLVLVLRAEGEPKTRWVGGAARDSFTDESHFWITPALPDADQKAPPPDGPITDEERRQALVEREKELLERYPPERAKSLLPRSRVDLDRLVTIKRKLGNSTRGIDSLRKSFSVEADRSYFLRPIVAIDNGVLVLGVSAAGSVKVGGKTLVTSKYGTLRVQMRIDEDAPIELDPANNPRLSLPQAGNVFADGAKNPDFEKLAEQAPRYAVVTGPAADALLDRMLAARVIHVRREPRPEYGTIHSSFTARKSFEVGSALRQAVDLLGLRKNPTSGRWELDPARSEARNELIAKAARP